MVRQVVCGGLHTLMLLQDGRVFGMGDNTYGQVGVPLSSQESSEDSSEQSIVELPVEITAFERNVKTLACGDEFSVALTTAGDVYTWGRGQIGQLGLGKDQQGPLATPTKVEGLPTIKKVFAGPNQVFAIEFTNGSLARPLERRLALVAHPVVWCRRDRDAAAPVGQQRV